MSRRPPVVRLYGLLLRLLPAEARADGRAMEETLAEQLAHTPRGWGRLRVAARALGRFPGVWTAEWLDVFRARGAPGRSNRGGGGGMMRDLTFAMRSLRKAPAFLLSTTALIAVGVGAVTTIFTLVDHVLLRPLPYPEPDRLVHLGNPSHSGPFFERLDGVEGVDRWMAAWTRQVTVTVGQEPLLLNQGLITPDFFDLLGAGAVRGRLLEAGDFLAADAVVLSADAWRTVWGADPDVVGRTLRVDGEPLVVVGVVEAAFQPPEALVGREVSLFRPLDPGMEEMRSTDYNILRIVGRTRPGVGPEAVQGQVDALLAAMAETHDNFRNRDGDLRQVPVTTLADATVQDVRRGLGLLLAAVGVLLLVACANVAHLFLARGLGRTREMAVRRALGAGTGTVARHLLAEALVVGAAGGLMGAGLAAGGLELFMALSPESLPRGADVSLDLRILTFAMVVSALTALAFGMVPALRSVRGDLAGSLHAGGRTATGGRGVAGLRNLLVTAEVALSLVLVAGAGLLVRSFVSVRAQETGFRVENVWTVPLNPTDVESPAEYRVLADELVAAAREVPGVEEAALGLSMPMQFTGGGRCCWGITAYVDGQPLEDLRVNMHPVTDRYLALLEVEVLAGRPWMPGEAATTPAPVVISEPLAVTAFGSAGAAVGRALAGRSLEMVVVGVVADNKHYGLEYEHGAAVYLPMEHLPFPIPLAHLAVRLGPGAGSGAAGGLRQAIWSVAPGLPVPTVRSMDEWISRSTAQRRFQSTLFGTFAAVGLLLAAGGLYGTLLFMAGQRRREMGIRLALGASRGRIERKLLGAGLALTAVGIALGVAGAWFSSRLLESQIWGVERGDPLTLGMAAGVLLVVAALASWLPARKAGRVDPLEALRVE